MLSESIESRIKTNFKNKFVSVKFTVDIVTAQAAISLAVLCSRVIDFIENRSSLIGYSEANQFSEILF